MNVSEIRSDAEFERLRDEWDGLLEKLRFPSTFASWEWLFSWWKAFGGSRRLRILVARDEEGLRGIAPLYESETTQSFIPTRALSLIRGRNGRFRLPRLSRRSRCSNAVMDAFARTLSAECERGTVLRLNEVPEHSPVLSFLRSYADRKKFGWAETKTLCGVLILPESWDQYLKVLKPRFRTRVRTALRDAESDANLEFGVCETEGEVERLLPVLYDLHTRRWALRNEQGVYVQPGKRAFYARLSSVLLERG